MVSVRFHLHSTPSKEQILFYKNKVIKAKLRTKLTQMSVLMQFSHQSEKQEPIPD